MDLQKVNEVLTRAQVSSSIGIRIVSLPGDASNRRYHRVFLEKGPRKSLILMELSDPENFKVSEEKVSGELPSLQELPFLNIQRFLFEKQVGVPRVYHYEMPAGWLFIEDLGDQTLEKSIEKADPEVIRSLYQQAIDELISIQSCRHPIRRTDCIAFARIFDIPLLMWEFDHFLEFGIEARCEIKISDQDRKNIRSFFFQISEMLTKKPNCFVHRDYHSRNLMVHQNRIRVIDFQDALMGPMQYDLASLLRDSYVMLPDVLVDLLVAYYMEQKKTVEDIRIEAGLFRELFDLMSIQRSLKAAGRFIYIDRIKKNPRFLPFVRPALVSAGKNLSRYPKLNPLLQLLQPFVEEFQTP